MAKLFFLHRTLLAFCAAIALAWLGAATASATTFSVDVAPGGQLMFSPASVSIQAGDTVTWSWRASGHSVTSGTPGKPSGIFDSGVNSSGFTFSHTFNDLGTFTYYCMPHGACCGMTGSVTVAAASPTPSPTAAQPLNISTRLEVKTGDQVLIGGFIITGTGPKRVILRALGPSLAGAGISDPLADPFLELHASDQSVITTNDNWRDSAAADIEATGLAPSNDLESALVTTLDPGSYTVILSGKNGATGVGLVEAYDLDGSATSQLANISTRGFVESGSNVMIGGFILGGGSENTNVLVRAIGPSLTSQEVSGALADPTLELHDVNGTLIQSNDNWKATQQTEIEATGLQPGNDLESAISETLAPGAYTAVVAGKNGTTGIGLVEVYRLP